MEHLIGVERLANYIIDGTRDGLMISGGGFQGKTETACQAAAEFEDLWRDIRRQLAPGPVPGTRDEFVPVAYCRLPVKATPKALCKTILDIYGDPHPATLHDLVRSVRDAVRDHATTALLIDDITRLRLHRGDDQDTLDLIRATVVIALPFIDQVWQIYRVLLCLFGTQCHALDRTASTGMAGTRHTRPS